MRTAAAVVAADPLGQGVGAAEVPA
jgi:hypothetical protein